MKLSRLFSNVLYEADTREREAQRAWQLGGGPEERERYLRVLQRKMGRSAAEYELARQQLESRYERDLRNFLALSEEDRLAKWRGALRDLSVRSFIALEVTSGFKLIRPGSFDRSVPWKERPGRLGTLDGLEAYLESELDPFDLFYARFLGRGLGYQELVGALVGVNIPVYPPPSTVLDIKRKRGMRGPYWVWYEGDDGERRRRKVGFEEWFGGVWPEVLGPFLS